MRQDQRFPEITLGKRKIGMAHPPLVIAEIGINHEGSYQKAVEMVDDACAAGCECVKFQCHVIEDEMIPNSVVPGNAKESIWDIMSRCALSKDEESRLKRYVEEKGMIYLSTPFSRAAADRLEGMGVLGYKIGSGECNNYPLIEHIAGFGKPVILSTGMNDVASVAKAVAILRNKAISYAVLHCTSIYPTPFEHIRLGALKDIQSAFPDAVTGLSDHSLSNYPCIAAVALGASILERHFTSSRDWLGPDINISMTPDDLKELIKGAVIIYKARFGGKAILAEETPTIKFAYASVVTICPVKKGDIFSKHNIWVKRPGTGEILAEHYDELLGKRATWDIPCNIQLRWNDVEA